MKRTQLEWEAKFKDWAGGPGITETAQCENAERMVKKAIAAWPELDGLTIDVFAQGSYKNVTNIPQESDVDISVCLLDTFYMELPAGTTRADFGIIASDRDFGSYRQDVIDAISDYFGSSNIEVGNKAIRVHSNTYRVDADVVANWEHRDYLDVNKPDEYCQGVQFEADDGKRIVNFPKQHTEQGIAKNGRTGRRFKRIVRALKCLQAEMFDEGIVSERLPSFFIESLVYNIKDEGFNHYTYRQDMQYVLAEIFNNTRRVEDSKEWAEVNGIKYLFHSTQPWAREQANAFSQVAWDYVGFE